MRFSVIIPTYNDWERLKLCLQALEGQTLSIDEFEILVVNNEAENTVPDLSIWPINAQLLHQPIPGSYAARNLGVKQAKGDILAFTDSDCIPDKDWLSNAEIYFLDKDVDRIGGKISIFFKNDKKKTAAELYESVFAFHQKHLINKMKSSVTANLLVRKEFFFKVGFFDSSKLSGGDFYWNQQANHYNLNIEYADDVLVMHPARASIAELATKRRRVIGGAILPKNNLKKVLMLLYFIGSRLLKPIVRVLFTQELSLIEKVRVIGVIVYLYFITSREYIRLISGGKPIRD